MKINLIYRFFRRTKMLISIFSIIILAILILLIVWIIRRYQAVRFFLQNIFNRIFLFLVNSSSLRVEWLNGLLQSADTEVLLPA